VEHFQQLDMASLYDQAVSTAAESQIVPDFLDK